MSGGFVGGYDSMKGCQGIDSLFFFFFFWFG